MKESMDAKTLLEDSKVFCIAPWTHLHVLTNGKVFPCCVSGHDAGNAVGDLQAGDTLESAWNSPRMRALRRNMLAGRSSKLCERCYVNEDLGIESFRTTENRQMAHHVHWVERTNASGALDTLHLPYLDLRVSNLCNLKCRICCHKYSTSWYDDAARLGLIAPGSPRQIEAMDDDNGLWEQLRPLIPSLEHVHFAGGEPLIMAEHYRLVNELMSLGRTDVRISYNTNFLVLRYKTFDAMSMWKRFPNVYVSASLDGMGARGDYMRKGQHWDRIEENRARLRRECPHVDFQVAATVSLMNVLHMPAFFRDWYEKGYVRSDRMKMYLLFEPEHYSVQGLPADLKRRVQDLYGEFIETYLAPLGEEATELIANFNAIVTHMKERDLDIASEFRRVTIELDLLRGESFTQTFPELAEFAAPTKVECARARRKLGDWAGSFQDYDEAIRLDPRNANAYAERGFLRRQSGDGTAALADLDTALELDPGLLDARLNRGVLLRERGEHTAALKDLNAVLERMDDVSRRGDEGRHAYIERGRIRRQCGDLTGALADFNQAVALVSQGDLVAPDLLAKHGLLVDRAEIKRALDDKAGELQDYDEAILRNPDEIWAIIGRARLRRENGALADALADYTRALSLAPHSALIAPEEAPAITAAWLLERAEVRRALGDMAGAVQDYDEAILRNPDEIWAVIGRGRLKREGGALADALADHTRALALVPRSTLVAPVDAPSIVAALLLERAEVERALGDKAGALQDYDEAIFRNPDEIWAFVGRARLRREDGALANALADYTRALSLVPHSARVAPRDAPAITAALLVERAEVKRALGDEAGALQDCEEAILHSPEDTRAYLERARAKRQGGDLTGASAAYDQALARTPPPATLPLILSERGVVKQALGDHIGSWRDFTHAVVLVPDSLHYINQRIAAMEQRISSMPVAVQETLDPAHPATPSLLYYARGVARRQRGEWDLAIRDFDRALELFPGENAPLRQLVDQMRQPEWDPLTDLSESGR